VDETLFWFCNNQNSLLQIGVQYLVFSLATRLDLVLAFLSEYLDPTVRRRQQVEEIGLPVIATLPRD